MNRRVADLLLMAAIVAGGFLVAKTGRERAGLRAEYGRLERAAGDLPVEDPTRVYVRALETGEPLHYAWRVYTPPNYNMNWIDSNGSGGSSNSTKAEEFLVRVRFREGPGGYMEVYKHLRGTSSAGTFGDSSLSAILRAHAGEILAERAGEGGVASFGPDERVVFLKLSLPDRLRLEAQTKLSPDLRGKFVPDLFRLELGPAPAQPGPVGPGG